MRPSLRQLAFAAGAVAVGLTFGAAACTVPGAGLTAPATVAEADSATRVAPSEESAAETPALPEAIMPLPWESTYALVEAPALRAAVDQLATFPEIQSAQIDEGGTPSDAYAAFRAVVALAEPRDQLALLLHEVPVVRGYMLEHVVPAHAVPDAVLHTLLQDETPVPGRVGCALGSGSIASRTVEALCAAAPEAVHVAGGLERAAAAARPDVLRARAVGCLARRDAVRAVVLATPLLDATDSDVRRHAVLALLLAEDSDALPRVAALARDPDPGVRAVVATALGRLGRDRSAVWPLTRDEDPYVRQLAGVALVELPGVDAALLAPLLADPAPRVRHGVAEAMARHGVALSLLEPMLMEPGVDGRIMRALSLRGEPELAPAMRRLTGAATAYVRERALDWLGRHGEDSDLPMLRAGLGAPSIGERRVAAAALARRADGAAIPLLRGMLGEDDNPNGRIAAAEALLSLDGAAGREAVRRAAENEQAGWARTVLLGLLQEQEPPVDLQGE